MLTHLSIENYTVVEALEVELGPGLTAITGETGAGKSIMLDALALCLGDRADPKAIRPGCARAEVTASFDVSGLPEARAWLAQQDLPEDECIVRRVLSAERSRAYINGTPATLQQCASLGRRLVDIHSQHAHQSLLRREVQRALLDHYGGAGSAAGEVAKLARRWQDARDALETLRGAGDATAARRQLLGYQVRELDELALGDDEIGALEAERRRLAGADEMLASAGEARELCDTLEGGARRALALLDRERHAGSELDNAREMLESAAIQAGEARADLQHYLAGIEPDPERLAAVERRLERIYDVARKHRVLPEALASEHGRLAAELEQLAGGEAEAEELERRLRELATAWEAAAARLSAARKRGARKLARDVAAQFGELQMGQCALTVALPQRDTGAPHPAGREQVEFLVTTNPGAAPQSLGRIASGGELSRISLAIQVVTARAGTIPAMVFDEVDVGIGGAVAEVVGRLLRRLADGAQVLCVTHLPQVAAQAHRQLKVSKEGDRRSLRTALANLDADGRVAELARMLGGVKVTEQTLAHAREMLEDAAGN
mgnify:CR=1 FL=1